MGIVDAFEKAYHVRSYGVISLGPTAEPFQSNWTITSLARRFSFDSESAHGLSSRPMT